MRSALFACLLACAVPFPALALGADDLVGAWHVLVHYKDAGTENPDTKRWEDRLWVFEKAGDQLRWADYPIVVFNDDSGRFDRTESGRYSRVLDYWEPNAAQQDQLRAGLAFNSRGARNKALSGSDAKGWSSARRGGGAYKSSRFVTYEETWSIDGLPDKPRFERQDSMGAAGGEDFEGRTLYETTEIEAGGDVLRGSFDRDGTRKGTFRIARSGAAHSVSEATGKVAGKEMKRDEFIAMLAPGLEQLPGERSEAEWREAVTSARSTEERLALRAALEEGMRTQVLTEEDVQSHYTLLTNLAVELERLFVEEKKSLADLRKLMVQGDVL